MNAIVIAYLLILLGIGWWFSRTQIHTATDYLLAGRNLGLLLCTGSLTATHFGGGFIFGLAEYGYNYGISGVWYGFGAGLGLILLGLLTAQKFRELALFTVPEFLFIRYQSNFIRSFSALLSLIALIGILAVQVEAVKRGIQILSLGKIDIEAATLIVIFIFILYTTLGGLWSVSVSDFFQVGIATLGIIIASILVFENDFIDSYKVFDPFTTEKLMASSKSNQLRGKAIVFVMLPTIMYTLVGQEFYQRLFSAKNERVAKYSAIIGGIFIILMSFFPIFIGASAHYSNLSSSEILQGRMHFTWIFEEVLNPVSPLLGGVVLAAILAATMSTADSLLTASASHVVKDLFRWKKDEKKLLNTSRLSTIVIGILALLIAKFFGEDIIILLLYSFTIYTASIFIPVLGGVLWKKGNSHGAIASILFGSLVTIIGILDKQFSFFNLGGENLESVYLILSLISSAVAFIALSFFRNS